jgi:succinoglycan biosynthesis transport protein ExoP
VVICSSSTFLISKKLHPLYQASTTFILSLGTSPSAFDNLNASVEAVPTYAQLLTSEQVLGPVLAEHRGVTLTQLQSVMTVKPQTNTQLIEVDVEDNSPSLAMQLANEIGQSFAQFVNTRLPGTVDILPAQLPTTPVSPKTPLNTAIGALVGLGLALALIVVFEWVDDRVRNPEEVQELLSGNVLAVLPRLTRAQRARGAMDTPAFAEGCRILSARLQAVQKIKPAKLLMITSPSGNEGKSMVATHLATALAMTGNQVLLVDANQPALPAEDERARREKQPLLLNNALETRTDLEGKLNGRPHSTPNLRVLTVGELTAHSPGVLPFPWNARFFEHFRKAAFDYIIFDAPSLLPSAESQMLASSAQRILLVIDMSQTPREVLSRVKTLINGISSSPPLLVMNKSEWTEWTDLRQSGWHRSHHRVDETAVRKLKRKLGGAQNDIIDLDATVILRSSEDMIKTG